MLSLARLVVMPLWWIALGSLALGGPARAQGEAPPEVPLAPPPETIPESQDSESVEPPAEPADPSDPSDPSDASDQEASAPPDAALPPPPTEEGEPAPTVSLRSSKEADAKLAECVPLVAAAKDGEARVCLDAVLAFGDDTTAALRVTALRAVLDVGAEVAPVAAAEETGFRIPPGRLELSSTAGLFGVWNGIAGGIAIAPHLPGTNPAPLILGTGALAVALGVGYGVGGYFLADALDLGEGDSRLVASSLVWGTTFGIASLPAVLDIIRPTEAIGVSLALGTVVTAGWLGGGAALGLASVTDLTAPHVSLINTGGWIGGLFGLLTIASLAPFAPALPVYSAGYLVVASAGLLAGALGGMLVDLSWGETLLLDLGAVLGTVTAGAIVMAVAASGAVNAVPSTVLIPVNSVATAAGTLGGLGVGLGATVLFRGEEGSIFRSFDEAVAVLPPMPTVVVDKEGDPAPMLLGPTLVF